MKKKNVISNLKLVQRIIEVRVPDQQDDINYIVITVFI